MKEKIGELHQYISEDYDIENILNDILERGLSYQILVANFLS